MLRKDEKKIKKYEAKIQKIRDSSKSVDKHRTRPIKILSQERARMYDYAFGDTGLYYDSVYREYWIHLYRDNGIVLKLGRYERERAEEILQEIALCEDKIYIMPKK